MLSVYTNLQKDTSLHALRTAVLLAGLLIPQVILFWNGEGILLLLRQDPRVAERAGVYLKVRRFDSSCSFLWSVLMTDYCLLISITWC